MTSAYITEEAPDATSDSQMPAETSIQPLVPSINNVLPMMKRKVFCLYPQLVSYLFKTFATDLHIVQIDQPVLK